jgi:hypothetical protein
MAFQKGKSGNPKGRPKGTSLGDEIRRLLEERDITGKTALLNKRLVAETLLKLSLMGDTRAIGIVTAASPPSNLDGDAEVKFTLTITT